MDKARSKRPPDVNEALSSMLWTPYDQAANTSSYSDSLTDDERQRGERKLNRYSNPLPNSLNWWNSHTPHPQPMAVRYSFPYYGNYFPSHATNDNFSSTTTTKRTVSTTIDVGNHGQTINTSTFSTTMVHSFTDDFYRYQNSTPQNLSECQSTHKYHTSQPSLLYDSNLNPTSNERINTHLVSPSNLSSTTTTTHDDKLFNHQRNNVRNTQANKWQNGKVGNGGDLNPYVHEDSNKKHERTCTNTTLCVEGKSRKVTQPPNVIQSYSTLSRKCNEQRGNKQSEHERNSAQTQTQRESKTALRVAIEGMAATQQASHNRDSKENAAECFVLDFYRDNRHDVDDQYRLFQNRSPIKSAGMERVNRDDQSYGGKINFINPQVTTEFLERDLTGNSQTPFTRPLSSYVQQQHQQHAPATTTSNVSESNAPSKCSGGSSNSGSSSLNGPCTSSVLFCKNDLDGQLKNRITSIDAEPINNAISCTVDVNDIEDESSRGKFVVDCNHVTVLISKEIDHGIIDESANRNVKCFQSADKSSSEAMSEPIINVDNLIITSAIENLSMVAVSNGTPEKAKYLNDIVTLREKRRRDRRDRRLARTRATNGASLSSSTNEILPDVINNHSPPPYADIPPQQIVPSIVSTVPVEDNRYTFSLPLVRRSTSDRSGKDCCGQWFNGPPLRFLVVLVALGGVACTLGGATLGSIALAGSPTSHLTAGLLMTGVGIVLVTISGVAWRMTTSEAHQCTGRCGRRQCARGNSSFGLLYPEFQHRPPPPSYQASMQDHRLREMMLNRDRQASNARASPPPTYRSNAGTLLRPPILFQRQCRNNPNTIQVEIPVDNSSPSNISTHGNSSVNVTSEFSEHQSSTSSQTITTIASINRLNDNEFTLMSASREMVADVTSLIKQNGRLDITGSEGKRRNFNDDDADIMNQISHEKLNISGSESRNINCNKDYVSVMDHNTALNHCKNVNISNTNELNKALIPIAHLSPSRDTLKRDERNFLDGARCEKGVR